MRWFTVLAFTLPIVAAQATPGRADERQPNVLFIAVDDLNDWVGCLGGHPQASTPNMDRLARRGTLFTNAHCQAPLCNPSRSSLLTGLRPSTTGIYSLEPGIRAVASLKNHVTLPQYLTDRGYFTATSGKIFHDGSLALLDRVREFSHWGDPGRNLLPPKKLVHTPDDLPAMDWGVFPERDEDQGDWKIADSAIAHLKQAPKDRPFFIGVGFRLPHVPCFASRKWFERLPEASLVMPAVKDDDRDDVPAFAWFLHWKLPEPRLSWLKQADQWRPLVRAYLASTSFMDSQIGRVLEALDASGRASETVVVLWSDHGWHLGEKGITGKNSLWERSTHVPLIFAGPGVAVGATCDQPCELLDIYPTLVELCGLPPRANLEGHSLVPQLRNAHTPRPWPAITTHNRGNHSIRSERWRFIRYADGTEELYDHRDDPHEWTNLANDLRFAEVKRDLSRWIPRSDAPPAPGSHSRLLDQQDGVWHWENEPVVPGEVGRQRPKKPDNDPGRQRPAPAHPQKAAPPKIPTTPR
jgi:choline-sulfatase